MLLKAAVLAGDRTELSTGRMAALLKRRAVAMVCFIILERKGEKEEE